jgi:hypothetical protein
LCLVDGDTLKPIQHFDRILQRLLAGDRGQAMFCGAVPRGRQAGERNGEGNLAQPLPSSNVGDASRLKSDASIDSLDDVMRRHIESTLQTTHGRVDGPFGAAKLLRINPHTQFIRSLLSAILALFMLTG